MKAATDWIWVLNSTAVTADVVRTRAFTSSTTARLARWMVK